jgi:hypothetical protein
MGFGKELVIELTEAGVAQRPRPAGDLVLDLGIALAGHAAFDDDDGLVEAADRGSRRRSRRGLVSERQRT